MPTRDCLDVVAALKELGCELAKETERHFFVCRGGVKLATVPKMMVTGRAQYEILDKLGFHDVGDDARYDQAVWKIARQRSLPGIPDVDRTG